MSSDSPGAVRALLEQMVRGEITERPGGFHVEGEVQGEDVRDANRAPLSALRRAERSTRLRAKCADGELVHRFFDYVAKGTRPAGR